MTNAGPIPSESSSAAATTRVIEDCTENLEDCFSETLHQDTSLSRFRVSGTLLQAQIKAVLDADQCRFSHFRSSETSESVRPRRISSRILSSVFFTSIARRATS